MKRKLLILAVMIMVIACLFIVSANAEEITAENANFANGVLYKSTSNEFGTVNYVADDVTINYYTDYLDKTSRVVIDNGDGTYSTYPTIYLLYTVTDGGGARWDFDTLGKLAGYTYANTSVVRVELPEGSNVLRGSTFKDCEKLVYVKIPASLSQLNGNSFQNCTNLATVEFAYDYETYTEHGSNFKKLGNGSVFAGCTSLTSLIFPNSLQHIDNSSFNGCTSLTTLVLGASFNSVNQVPMIPKSVTQLILSDSFCADARFFGWTNSNSGAVMPTTFVMYYTGNLEQANTLRSTAVSCYEISKAEMVSYQEFTSETFVRDESLHYFVYGYNKCDAFYNSNHTPAEDDFNCTTGISCTICKETQAGKTHSMQTIWTYENGYASTGWKICKCVNEETCMLDGGKTEGSTPAIITALGYSIKIDTTHGYGIRSDYKIDEETLSEYNDYLGEGNELEIGVVATNADTFASKQIMVNGELNSPKGVKIEVNEGYSSVSCVLAGFTSDIAESLKLVISLYIIDADGTEYVQSTDENNNYSNLDEEFAENERLDIVTIAGIARITGDDISGMPEA